MSYKTRAKDEGVVDDGGSLMCRAHGCPLKWSVQTGEVTACSYHAWSDPKEWPRITEQIRMGLAVLKREGETVTVADMKTRLRKGGKLNAPDWNVA